jgi:hypothetical protein
MATVGPVTYFSIGMASNTTLTSAIDLAGAWGSYKLVIPTMTSGTDIRIQASETSTGTFRRLYHVPTVASATPTVINIPSSVTNCIVELPKLARNVKIEFTTACTASSHQFSIICNAN